MLTKGPKLNYRSPFWCWHVLAGLWYTYGPHRPSYATSLPIFFFLTNRKPIIFLRLSLAQYSEPIGLLGVAQAGVPYFLFFFPHTKNMSFLFTVNPVGVVWGGGGGRGGYPHLIHFNWVLMKRKVFTTWGSKNREKTGGGCRVFSMSIFTYTHIYLSIDNSLSEKKTNNSTSTIAPDFS